MINSDVQRLEPGNRLRLFEVDGSSFGADLLRFHAETIAYGEDELMGDANSLPAKVIWWQGKEYHPWPVEIKGIELSSEGRSAEPVLTVANLDNTISALCYHFNDMVQARVTIHETFAHYLDARNFPQGNPQADPTQEFIHVWFIDRKNIENKKIIEFSLYSPADLQGQKLPSRQIHNLCVWSIRGDYRSGRGCDYAGQRRFDINGKPTDDPAKDRCGGRLSDCKLRFGKDNSLPFGGFPASTLIKGR